MATLIWGWAFVWLAWRLVLEWQVGREWLPDSGIDEEDRQGGRSPPPNALTSKGERLWRTRWNITCWGFLGWCLLVSIAVVRTFLH